MGEVKEILDSCGVEFWLDYGTALAAYRDKKPMFHDTQDIDVSVRIEDVDEAKLNEIEKKFLDKNWKYPQNEKRTEYLFQQVFKKGPLHCDIWYFHKVGDYRWRTWYRQDGLYIWLVCPARYYEGLKTRVVYCEKEFLLPNEVENYLILTYGLDWKVPMSTNYGDVFALRTRVQYERFVNWINGKYDEKKYLTEGYKL
jgi:hypothetical protein